MNAVIYARYSSDNQREESIEGQLRECKEYADQNGITVVRTYIDRALSAKTDSRPQFQQMIHDSATHTFEAVLVWKLDRFSRNRYDSAHYKRILKNNRVHVVSVTEPISNTPEGIMLESLLEGMAEYYSAELAEKVSRGHKENALKAAQEKLEEATKELEKYNAVAPIDGTVLQCSLTEGQEVSSGQASPSPTPPR